MSIRTGGFLSLKKQLSKNKWSHVLGFIDLFSKLKKQVGNILVYDFNTIERKRVKQDLERRKMFAFWVYVNLINPCKSMFLIYNFVLLILTLGFSS